MDYTDVIFQNDMDGAGIFGDLVSKAKEVTTKAKEEAKKRGEEIAKKTEEMWKNREAIVANLSKEAKERYEKLKAESKVLLDSAKTEYTKAVENLTLVVESTVNNIINTTEEYKTLAGEKLEEVRAKLTQENLQKLREDAEKKYNEVVATVEKKLNDISTGGDNYQAKYLKYKAKYLALKKQLENSESN